MRLFSYCVHLDTGSSPNPYGDYCTLALTKPVIRRLAQVGDWIVGLASPQSKLKNASRRVIYAMKVSQVLTLEEYDLFCRQECSVKIPRRPTKNYEDFVGDCVYEFKADGDVAQRMSVHNDENIEYDLAGIHALVSDHFVYFGSQAPELPESLYKIIKKGHGHQLDKNKAYVEDFVEFISEFERNEVMAAPLDKIENWYGAESRGQTTKVDLEACRFDEEFDKN